MAQKTAMIVDDIPFARNMIKEILTAAKYAVVAEASNGDEAIALFKKHKPDFVTMDIVMPKKGGIEATRNILESEKEARIIIVSALGHEHLLIEAVNAGARDYVIKPFAPEDLLKAVEKALQEDTEQTNQKGGQ